VLVEFFGVRGSCPCPSPQHGRYGGNTACVSLTVENQPPIILDLGTGLRSFGGTQPTDGSFRGTALVTHIHWDHVQGLPFFPPADRTGAQLDIYGPVHPEGTLAECFDGFMRPPYFPIRFRDLRGEYRFHDVADCHFRIGEAEVLVREVPHTGPTLGYRVTWDGATVTYISDHQAPIGLDSIPDTVLELASGADLLIHDAQYTRAEFAEKAHWGHCTTDYALKVAQEAGARRLVLFHHDPAHTDREMDRLLAETKALVNGRGPKVLAAAEGMRLKL
jgi:phosphoribosyl 1,2-cyclic phosphodiesterase